MICRNNLIIKSILIVLFMGIFLEGVEDKGCIPEPKGENPAIAQTKQEGGWRTFGSIGVGGIFGVIDNFGTSGYKPFGYIADETRYRDRYYFEANLGVELIFEGGNGFNIFFDADNQSLMSMGANYVYELTGKYKFAFMTGLDIGPHFLESQYYPFYTTAASPLVRYNLGARYRDGKHALGMNLKIPLYQITLKDQSNIYRGDIKNYAGVVVSIAYTYFFKI